MIVNINIFKMSLTFYKMINKICYCRKKVQCQQGQLCKSRFKKWAMNYDLSADRINWNTFYLTCKYNTKLYSSYNRTSTRYRNTEYFSCTLYYKHQSFMQICRYKILKIIAYKQVF